MSKYYIIIAHDGTEVIDATSEAENRMNAMDCAERRYKRNAGFCVGGRILYFADQNFDTGEKSFEGFRADGVPHKAAV